MDLRKGAVYTKLDTEGSLGEFERPNLPHVVATAKRS